MAELVDAKKHCDFEDKYMPKLNVQAYKTPFRFES